MEFLRPSKDQLVISGMFGEDISFDGIEAIQFTEGLPKIIKRNNGFYSGTKKKGYFKLENKKSVKLIIDTQVTKYIIMDKKKGKDVYYNDSKKDATQVFDELKRALDPDLFEE